LGRSLLFGILSRAAASIFDLLILQVGPAESNRSARLFYVLQSIDLASAPP
jgi:hypothetical protein